MIVNSSALLEVPNREPDRFQKALSAALPFRLSMAHVLKTSTAVEEQGSAKACRKLRVFRLHAEIEPAPIAFGYLEMAQRAWSQFGKDRHSGEMIHSGCFAYPLASVAGESLLYRSNGLARAGVPVGMLPPCGPLGRGFSDDPLGRVG